MNRSGPPRLSTGFTLLWFAALTGLWELAPVPDAWKVLPVPSETFLVRGWSDSSESAGPLQNPAAMIPPPLPEGEDDEDVDLSTMLAVAPGAAPPASAARAVGPSVGLEAAPGGGAPFGASTSTGLVSAQQSSAQTGRVLEADAAPTSRRTVAITSMEASSERIAPTNLAPADGPLASAQLASSSKPRRSGSSLIAPLPDPYPIEQGCRSLAADGRCLELALEPFYRALARTARKEPGAVTRITHFGDSVIASDYISATVRRRLQRIWGDSGHGFLLAARPWRWYDHRGVTHQASNGWLTHGIIFNRFKDRYFGLGGVSFQTAEAGLTAEFATATSGPMGRAVARFDIYYQEQPAGGSIDILVDKKLRHRLNTRSDQVRSAFYALEVPDGPARLSLRTVGDGQVRLFGVTLERSQPGIVYDSLGIVGGSMGALRKIAPAHWAEQLRRRDPALVVLSFGANESLTYHRAGSKVMREYERAQAAVLRQIRAALPEASILVMSPLDAAERVGDELRTRPSIPKLAAAQRRAALEVGAAWWDTFAVMGGEGSMARWARSRLGSSDLVHPSWSGAVFIGNELSRSLVAGFREAQAGQVGPVARVDAAPGVAAVVQTPAPAAPSIDAPADRGLASGAAYTSSMPESRGAPSRALPANGNGGPGSSRMPDVHSRKPPTRTAPHDTGASPRMARDARSSSSAP